GLGVRTGRASNAAVLWAGRQCIASSLLRLARNHDREALTYLASLLRQPQVRLFPGDGSMKVREQPAVLDTVREFVGVEPAAPELDTVLATVLFTDIVDSTGHQAALGDRAWKDV